MPLPGEIVESFPDAQHARWGQGSGVLEIPTPRILTANHSLISTITHPLYDLGINDWFKWRLTFKGGEHFIEEYTKRFSKRESTRDFRIRKQITPVPAFAKGAINEIKNAIFQRTSDTTRRGGPLSYEKAVKGEFGGVDLKSATMNWFIGHYVLPELLTMSRIGVYVDNQPKASNLADQQGRHPYLYTYKTEDIRSWAYSPVNEAGLSEFSSILLREYVYIYDESTGLPRGETERFRHVFIGPDKQVHIKFFDWQGNPISNEQILEITKIPFVVFELSDSLLRDVANTQIALLNLESSDISYALKGNYPFYTEQFNTRENLPIIRQAQSDYRELVNCDDTCAAPTNDQQETEVGASQGRRYPIGADRPGFIHPSPEPLRVSMDKQESLKKDIRQLVHLALSTIQPKMASAESKSLDQQGLESGLSYIGLELERGERLIAAYWSMYENVTEIPTIIYPKQWSLKSTADIQAEVDQLTKVRDDIPSSTFKIQVNKKIAGLIIGPFVATSTMDTIEQELQDAKGASSNPKTIVGDVETGLLGLETATNLRGYPPDEVAAAARDHAERLARITQAQTPTTTSNPASGSNPAARGLPDLSPNPTKDAASEKVGKQGRGVAK